MNNTPLNLAYIDGDLLNPPTPLDAIAHQCNCVTVNRAAGLADKIFTRWPECSIYHNRHPRVAGEVIATFPQSGRPIVLNILGQVNPGPPTFNDTARDRLVFFRSALFQIADAIVLERFGRIEKIGFPHGIGCGLAAGDWRQYRAAIETFAFLVRKSGTTVYILRKE